MKRSKAYGSGNHFASGATRFGKKITTGVCKLPEVPGLFVFQQVNIALLYGSTNSVHIIFKMIFNASTQEIS